MNLGRDRLLTEATGELSRDQRVHLVYWPRGVFFSSVTSRFSWDPGERGAKGEWVKKPLLVFKIVTGDQEPEDEAGLPKRLTALVASCKEMLGFAVEVVVEVDGEKCVDTRESHLTVGGEHD